MNKSKLILAILLVVTFSGVSASAQSIDSSQRVHAEAKLSPVKIRTGAPFRVAVGLKIEEGWHINSHIPTFAYLIGTTVALTLPKGMSIVTTHYPPGKRVRFDFAKEPLSVYDNSVNISLRLRAAKSLKPGEYSIPVSIRVQACNDTVCLPPSKIEKVVRFYLSAR